MTLVVLSGAIADKPFQGGSTWVRLSFLRGLEKLGYDVFLIDQIAATAGASHSTHKTSRRESTGRSYFEQVVTEFGLVGKASLILGDGEETLGATLHDLAHIAGQADLLINISGHLKLDRLLPRFRRKVYIDIDPGFTQLWHADPATPFEIGGHDYYYTIGENIGSPDCSIPTAGIHWRTMRQPVVLDDWPVTAAETTARFTTIANWRGPFGAIEHDGRTLGLKVHEFRRFVELPRWAPYTFELALNLDPADDKDRRMLLDNGWRLAEPAEVAANPADFRNYVQRSSAEFSVAQGMYVATNSGWFSDRTVRYLASGKPALVQDTGWSRHLPNGRGLHAFRTMDEAVFGARHIVEAYDDESAAARTIAEQYFDSNKVLGRLMDEIGLKP